MTSFLFRRCHYLGGDISVTVQYTSLVFLAWLHFPSEVLKWYSREFFFYVGDILLSHAVVLLHWTSQRSPVSQTVSLTLGCLSSCICFWEKGIFCIVETWQWSPLMLTPQSFFLLACKPNKYWNKYFMIVLWGQIARLFLTIQSSLWSKEETILFTVVSSFMAVWAGVMLVERPVVACAKPAVMTLNR